MIPSRRVGRADGRNALVATMLPVMGATSAQAFGGSAFTTDATGGTVNQDLYDNKCDVYINGGPNNGANRLTDGGYCFAVLEPGGQSDPNDAGTENLSDDVDTRPNRRATVQDGRIVASLESHARASDPSTTATDDLIVQLRQFATTSNPGGAYISPALGTWNVVLTATEASLLGLTTCTTVNRSVEAGEPWEATVAMGRRNNATGAGPGGSIARSRTIRNDIFRVASDPPARLDA